MNVNSKYPTRLLISNDLWKSGPATGFLTPTALSTRLDKIPKYVYGAVRDKLGRAVIRGVVFSVDSQISPFQNICYDRRGSNSFDHDGTILGHVASLEGIVRLYYVGFRKSKKVKFRAFSGLAESLDGGLTFEFQRRILHERYFSFLNNHGTDIIACHWNNLDINGDGLALVAIGDGWLARDSGSYPKYSSYLIEVRRFEFSSLVAKIPQKKCLYRLGRPRFLNSAKPKILVATGGKVDGDYRPYFFEFANESFEEREDMQFPILPGVGFNQFSKQVSYPEMVKTKSHNQNLFLFNGDQMGSLGCFSVQVNEWEV